MKMALYFLRMDVIHCTRPWQDLIAVLNTKIRRLLCCYK